MGLRIDRTNSRVRPGMKAGARIALDTVSNSILVPTQALFKKNGATVVYVASGRTFSERAVQLGRRSGDIAQIIDGVKPGERVALKDPTEAAANR